MTETSREYAIALFTLGKETNTEKEIAESLDFLRDIFAENPEYVEFLASPSISKNERIDSLKKLLNGRVHEYAESFALLLCEKNRIRNIVAYIDEYKNLHDLVARISKATIKSAINLSENEKTELLNKLSKKCGHTVEAEFIIDKSIIGGIVIEVDGNVYDGSVKQYLSEIKEVIYK